MAEIRLMPCPFCGGESVFCHHEQTGVCWVRCKKCGVTTRGGNRLQVVEAWNTRAERTCHKGSGWYCEECEQSGGDLRMCHCPNCGARVVS